MNISNLMNFVMAGGWLATFLFVGKNRLRTQTIEGQASLIGMLQQQNQVQAAQIDMQSKEITTLTNRVAFLEELFHVKTGMVPEGTKSRDGG